MTGKHRTMSAAEHRALPPDPELCYPDCPHVDPERDTAWAILYEDPDHRNEVFFGAGAEEAARRRFAQARQMWNCTLFRQYAPMGWETPDQWTAPAVDPGELTEALAVFRHAPLTAQSLVRVLRRHGLELRATGDGVRLSEADLFAASSIGVREVDR